MLIHRGNDNQIVPYFTERELYSRSSDAPEVHELDDNVINGLVVIRKHFATPVIVTSSFRTRASNALAGGSKNSQHLKGKAIDAKFKYSTIKEKYDDDILAGGDLFVKLRQAGITGFGLYDNFFHIDSRDPAADVTNQEDVFGRYSIWDNRVKKKGKIELISAIKNSFTYNEDGINDWRKTLFMLLFIFLVMLTAGIVIYHKIRK